MFSLYTLLSVASYISLSHAGPMKRQDSQRIPQAPARAAIVADFPDPSIIQTNNQWYAFATSSNGINVQVAQQQKSRNFNGGWTVLGVDALPTLPDWAAQPVWAPDVIQRDDGMYVLYYSGALKQFPEHHCIGAAISSTVEGPYDPMDTPLICPDPDGKGTNVNPVIQSAGRGGAIDASGFTDVDGTRYVVYKVDGNSVGSGGICGNSNPGQEPTPIMLVKVAADGVTPLGAPVQILDRMEIDGPLVEAPSILRTNDGMYNLFFSSNCYSTPEYDISWASSSSITGPYTRAGPLLTTGDKGLTAPGGATVTNDGQHIVYHADMNGGRAMFTDRIVGSGADIRLASSSGFFAGSVN